jgi:hypothetical protein
MTAVWIATAVLNRPRFVLSGKVLLLQKLEADCTISQTSAPQADAPLVPARDAEGEVKESGSASQATAVAVGT